MESIDTIIKGIALVAAVIGLPRIIEELTTMKRSRLREEFKFIKEFISELASAHPFVVEKGYLAISGSDTLTADEIHYLFSLKSPGQALKKYAKARKYLEFKESTANSAVKIAFRQEYPERMRQWLKWLNLGGYAFFAILAFTPLFFAKEVFGNNWQMALTISAACLGFFGMLAYSFLSDYARILRGEELVAMQVEPIPENHT